MKKKLGEIRAKLGEINPERLVEYVRSTSFQIPPQALLYGRFVLYFLLLCLLFVKVQGKYSDAEEFARKSLVSTWQTRVSDAARNLRTELETSMERVEEGWNALTSDPFLVSAVGQGKFGNPSPYLLEALKRCERERDSFVEFGSDPSKPRVLYCYYDDEANEGRCAEFNFLPLLRGFAVGFGGEVEAVTSDGKYVMSPTHSPGEDGSDLMSEPAFADLYDSAVKGGYGALIRKVNEKEMLLLYLCLPFDDEHAYYLFGLVPTDEVKLTGSKTLVRLTSVFFLFLFVFSLLLTCEVFFTRREVRRLEAEVKNLERELKEIDYRDGLTKLYNRPWFEKRLEEECGRARRYGVPLSLAVMDVDDFAKYNEEHGIWAGNEALAMLGELIKSHLRSTDFAARYDEDEFALIFTETDLYGATNACQRIREAVEEYSFPQGIGTTSGKLTVTVGVTSFTEDDLPETLISKAFEGVQEGKEAGKNRVVVK